MAHRIDFPLDWYYTSRMSEAGRYFSAHHEKTEQEVYHIVPQMLGEILDLVPELDGFVIGGSYAAGTWKEGDDVDVDLIYSDVMFSGRGSDEIIEIFKSCESRWNITIEVRGRLVSPDIDPRIAFETYRPGTPYVVRSEEVALYWGLINGKEVNRF